MHAAVAAAALARMRQKRITSTTTTHPSFSLAKQLKCINTCMDGREQFKCDMCCVFHEINVTSESGE
jgi:hypothetical protein